MEKLFNTANMTALALQNWTRLILILCCTICVESFIRCDFENSVDRWCGFSNDANNELNFQLISSASSIGGFMGPTVDHTYSNTSGHYIYIDTTIDSVWGAVSRIKSPMIVGAGTNDEMCVEFYYHMYGPSSQNLHIYIKDTGHALPDYSSWNRSGNLGDSWHTGAITLRPSASTGFQIVFQATKGYSFWGDIALDDISITNGACQTVPTSIPVLVGSTPAPLTSFDCNLDDASLCGMTQDTRSQFFWSWRGNSPQPIYGPVGDHTSGSTSGYYIFVPAVPSSQISEERSRVISPLLAQNSKTRCLQFYYFMNGVNDAGSLNVYILLNGGTLPITPDWSMTANKGNVWTAGYLNIPSQSDNYQIVFEGIRRTTYDGSVAIDDILLTDDSACPRLHATSDFEDGLGDFVQDENDDMDWYLWSSSTPSLDTGPSFDHTYGNSSGHYIYIETSSPSVTGHVARLMSPLIISTKDTPRCLVFWYHMYGLDVDTLNIYITNGTASNKPTYLWSLSGNRGDRWRAAEVQLESAINFQVVFEALRGVNFQGDIAIDDIIIDSQFCPGEFHFHNYSSISCNFEEREICYYEQDQTDDADWVWQNGATDQTFTGPDVDHTTGSELGFFMYISESTSTTPGSLARLWSPMAEPQNSPSCVQFWYHMYGSDVETLNVYIKTDGQSIPSTPSWSMSGDQGDYWHRATIDIVVVNVGFRVVFEGVTGSDYKDDIAIDDVMFFNSTTCPIVTTDPPPPTTAPTTQENATCDFESDDICGYSQLINDAMDWTRYKGATPSLDTGPTEDHTLGTSQGYYMYLECSDTYDQPGDAAQLGSPYLTPKQHTQCMEFFFHMWGTDVDLLNIYVVAFGDSLPLDPHMTLYGEHGNQWIQALVDIPAFSKPYQVIFEATKGKSFAGDIAIDDIMFYDGPCPTVTPDPAVVNANCDFEQNDTLCGYYQDTEDDFDWTLNSGNTTSDSTGPSTDHTLGTAKGHYLYIEASIPQRPGHVARLTSPQLAGNMDEFCLQFYYHMKGEEVGYLRVLWSASYYEPEELIRIVGNQGDKWKPTSVDLLSTDGDFMVTFEGAVGAGRLGDIAIDDIYLLRQPCQGFPKESACTFDAAGPGDFCGYKQSSQDDFDWQWYDGSSSNAPVHGDSAYVYFSPSNSQPGQTGRLVSPKLAGMSNQHCLDFDYVLYQDNSQKLTIAVLRADGVIYNLLTLTGNMASSWSHHSRTLNETEIGRNFQIIFIGIVGEDKNRTGVIALDNPTIRLGKCNELPSPDTGKQTTNDSNPSVVVLGITLGVIMLAIVVLVIYYIQQNRAKPPMPALPIKYTNGETQNLEMPTDMTIDNPNYNLTSNDFNATEQTA